MSAKRARASAARKVSRRGSRRGFMRGFRGGVSGNGFTGGSHGCPFSVRRHRPPSSAALHPRAPRSRPNVATLRAPLSSTKMQRSPKRRSAALPQAPTQHCTFPKRQDAAHLTKTLHCPPRRCAAHQDAALLRALQCYAPPNIAALRIPQMAKARRCSLFGYENIRTMAAFMPKFLAFIPNMPPRAPSDSEHRRVFAKSKPLRAA